MGKQQNEFLLISKNTTHLSIKRNYTLEWNFCGCCFIFQIHTILEGRTLTIKWGALTASVKWWRSLAFHQINSGMDLSTHSCPAPGWCWIRKDKCLKDVFFHSQTRWLKFTGWPSPSPPPVSGQKMSSTRPGILGYRVHYYLLSIRREAGLEDSQQIFNELDTGAPLV